MADFDGESFVALHDDIVAPDLPLDPMAALAIRSQMMELATNRGASVGLKWRRRQADHTLYLGDRPWASFRWLVFWIAPFWVTPDLKTVRVTLLARASCEDPSDPTPIASVQIRAQLAGFASETIAYEVSSAGDYEQITIELELGERPSRTVPTQLRLWMRSEAKGSASVEIATAVPDVPALGPDEDDLTVLGYRSTSTDYDTLVHLSTFATGATTDFRTYPPVSSGDFPDELVYLSYLQVRSVFVDTLHDPSPPKLETFRAGITVKGATEGQQLLMQRRVARRPRPVLLGPRGFLASDNGEYLLYHEMWRYVRADGDTGISTDDFPLWEVVRFDEVSGVLDIDLLVLPYFYAASFRGEEQDALFAAENLATCSWDFTLTLEQIGGQTFTDLTKTVELKHLATDTSGAWPALVQLHWRHRASPHASHPANRYFTCKEGALYPPDLNLLVPVRLQYDLSELDVAAMGQSVEVLLEIQANGTPSGGFPGAVAEDDNTYLAVVAAAGTHLP